MSIESKFHTIAEGFSGVYARSYNSQVFDNLILPEREYLNRFVKEQKEKVEKAEGIFFDGDLIGVRRNSFEIKDKDITFEAQHIKYSQHASIFRNKEDAPIQALYVNGIVITTDNKIIMGTTQATEANWMGKLGIPAGGVNLCPDGFPSLGYQLFVELSEEIGFAPDYHLNEKIIPGWVNGRSNREGNYHLTTTFIVPLRMDEKETNQWFEDWKFSQEKWMKQKGMKTEFKNLRFLPNDPKYLRPFIMEQDEKGKNANLLGKSLDVIDKWANSYDCDISKLLETQEEGPKLNLPVFDIYKGSD